MKKEDILNICKNMLCRVQAKYDIINNNEVIEEKNIHIVKDNRNIVEYYNRKEREYKLYIKLSIRRKKHRIREVKNLIIKIANPNSNDKEEYINQYVHILEDAVEQIYKIKGSKV